MKRRGFIRGLGLGGVLGAVAAPAPAHAAATRGEERRDLAWARKMAADGHRVRLERWADVDRPEIQGDEGVVTIRQGTRAGIVEFDELVVTVEVLEGPWEVVPQEDYPKPAPEPEPGDLRFEAWTGGDVWLATGDRSAQLTLHGGPTGEVFISAGSPPSRS